MTQRNQQFYERDKNESSFGSTEVDNHWTEISPGPRLDLEVLYVAPEKVIIQE